MFVDTHCHLNSDEFRENPLAYVKHAREAGVKRMLVVGTNVRDSLLAVNFAREMHLLGVYAAVGIHPHDARTVGNGFPQELLELLQDPVVAALGEAGLDYHYDHSPRDRQLEVFRMQIRIAKEQGRKSAWPKPLVIHVREAMDDALSLLEEEGAQGSFPGIFHCYSGGLKYLDRVLDLGFYCSIAGPVTFKNNEELRAVAARIPEERLLCETDCPWLTPVPHRGTLNEPAFVIHVYEAVARARGSSVEKTAECVARNADRLFHWGVEDV
jgi:TatD DNase family protein